MTDSAKELADARRLIAWCKERVQRAAKATEAMKPSPAAAS
jgi:hypothetical protein